ncbi:RluA family pseudouridine synthase [Lentilactobacillus sp. Marseille-Q4993]|uniref:RluA family pseudouridine synthase n=1 Tax=Lentilactobacillus sp. Marseille-Q4993 TaxID=3039492 RepID=UPI0024BC6B77|nr:RluA family pseudouridine synthase [Lentilactobacillus sp. Marseille-Q4993]
MSDFKITEKEDRLDKLVPLFVPSLTRSKAKTLIESGAIKVNSQRVKPKYTAKIGDVVSVEIPEIKETEIIPEDIDLDIVYEDDDVIVVNKPTGMVVHPAAGHPSGTLVNALLYHSPLSHINGEFRPGIVHRIDKDTSGLLMVAKNDHAHIELSKQLKEKKNLRLYVALVHGVIKEDSGTINAPIGRSKNDRKKQAIVADGRDAITHFTVIERFKSSTLIHCRLETGRTHQIRVHMKYINHPLIGDPLYGPKKSISDNGQYLHAAELGFIHPTSHKLMMFSAPLPAYFNDKINQLRNDR